MKNISLLVLLVWSNISASAQFKLRCCANRPQYVLNLPRRYSLSESKDGEWQVEKEALLKDSSVIYITQNLKDGIGHSIYKAEKYNHIYLLNNFVVKDTSNLFGFYHGKLWREFKYYYVVVGYYNATSEEKPIYDKVIDAIIPQVDKIRAAHVIGK